MRLRFTPRSRSDIATIFDDVAAKNPGAARRIEKKIQTVTANLRSYPEVGVPTDMVDVRRLPLVRYPYTIFYRVNWLDETVEILRVVHGASVRDLGAVPK